MTALSSTGPQGFARSVVLRVLQFLIVMSVAIGIRRIMTGTINLVALQVFITGIGVGVFGSWWSRASSPAPSSSARAFWPVPQVVRARNRY